MFWQTCTYTPLSSLKLWKGSILRIVLASHWLATNTLDKSLYFVAIVSWSCIFQRNGLCWTYLTKWLIWLITMDIIHKVGLFLYLSCFCFVLNSISVLFSFIFNLLITVSCQKRENSWEPVLYIWYSVVNENQKLFCYRLDCTEPIFRTQHGLNSRMNSPESELTSLPVHVSLQDRELWDQFSSIGTEMLITKSGRYAPTVFWNFNRL